MKKYLVSAVAAAAFLATGVTASAASFDISEPLSTNGPLVAPWVVTGTVTPAVVDGALLLTNTDTGQRGFALYNEAISVTRGIDVTFSQAQWGGDGADGIVFFVKKGSDSNTTPGASGGALGYAPSALIPASGGDPEVPAVPGLSGALLGVGLDAYGNFASTDAEGDDCVTTFARGGGNAIVVRGAGQGQLGYCLLADSYGLNANALNPLSANYATRLEAARVVRVVIDPANATNPRVKVYYDGGTTPVVDIALPAAFSSVPSVKIGFSAGTGGSVDTHNVWGLTSTAAPASSAGEDLATTGSSQNVGIVALLLGILATIAAVALRPRRRAQQ
jgi:hypothetical protein